MGNKAKGWTSKVGAGAARVAQRGVALGLIGLMAPMATADLWAQQDYPPPPPADYGYGAPQQGAAYQALPPDQLDQLVAPIALYPDSLVAQILAASTYPAQVAGAEQFLQQYGGAPPEQIAQMADQQPWDPSVKALTAFPQVLGNLSQNMQWSTALGNAYYNQPQDVMSAVQAMRQRAYAAGSLRPTPQLAVDYAPGAIVIAPVSPTVVYVPYYNPWVVYGGPIAPWRGYYYHPPVGLALGVGLAIGFTAGVVIGAFTHFGWGFHSWAPDWRAHTVVYQHNTYISRSVTVINHGNYGGFDRNPQARAFNQAQAARFDGGMNRGVGGGNFARPGAGGFNGGARPGGSYGQAGAYNRPAGSAGVDPRSQSNYRGGGTTAGYGQAGGGYNRSAGAAGAQFNGAGNRPTGATAGQFHGGAREGNYGGNRTAQPSYAGGGARPQAQFNGGGHEQSHAESHSSGGHDSHGGGGGHESHGGGGHEHR